MININESKSDDNAFAKIEEQPISKSDSFAIKRVKELNEENDHMIILDLNKFSKEELIEMVRNSDKKIDLLEKQIEKALLTGEFKESD